MSGKSSKGSKNENKMKEKNRSPLGSREGSSHEDELQFKVTKQHLWRLMEERGMEGKSVLDRMGGVNKLCDDLHTSPTTGLIGSAKDIAKRQEIYGKNVIPPKRPKSLIRLLWDAIQDPTLMVLMVCACVSLILELVVPKKEDEGHYGWVEGVGILICVMVVVVVTAGNDFSKQKQFSQLQKKVDAQQVFPVIRKGEITEINIQDIVVGDVCLVKYGDEIPADGIIINCSELKIDESTLTGESDLVKKSVQKDPMLLSGTSVMEGSGRMVVTAVGPSSQSGIVMALLSAVSDDDEEEEVIHTTVLQAKLTLLTLYLGYFAMVSAGLVLVILATQFITLHFVVMEEEISWSHVNDMVKILITCITILVMAIPEGLPLAVTLALAYSVSKMTKENNLVRHLHACETMGNATTICSDKTGTLTTNRMTVVQSYICEMHRKITPTFMELDSDLVKKISQNIALNTAPTSIVHKPKGKEKLSKHVGNKTECALLEFMDKMGLDYRSMRSGMPEGDIVHVYTFSSTRKNMTTVVRTDKGYRILTKGAAEVILEKCRWIVKNGGVVVPLTSYMHERVLSHVVEPMAREGLRCITVASRDFVMEGNIRVNDTGVDTEPNWDMEDTIVTDLTCLAVFGIKDPVREEVPEAVALCQKAGVVVRMVTGDNINTARSIAHQCGIIHVGDGSQVMEGKEFNRRIRGPDGRIKQNLFDKVWPQLRVLARSTPTDKYNLVKGIVLSNISKSREVVAVTGDGTNDAPALKKADVGFSMGITGTDVAKQASDIIITDDNFYSIVRALLWGRNVYDSITKFLQFQTTANVSAIAIALVGVCATQMCPLRALQMLWVNLVMDSVASLALATEYPSLTLLDRMPYGRTKPIISVYMIRIILGQSFYCILVCLIILFTGQHFLDVSSGIETHDPTPHLTVVFNTFVMVNLFNEVVCRKVHGERNVFKGIFSNPIFLGVFGATVVGQVIIVEFGGVVFATSPLRWDLWIWCVGFGLGALLWHQLVLCVPVDYYNVVAYWELASLEQEARFLALEWVPELDVAPKRQMVYLRALMRLKHQTMLPHHYRRNVWGSREGDRRRDEDLGDFDLEAPKMERERV